MKRKKSLSKNEKSPHVGGSPWKTVAKCETFEEADQKRNELLLDETLQVKVHYQGVSTNRYFAVKARLDPKVAAALEKAKKNKARGKRRKK